MTKQQRPVAKHYFNGEWVDESKLVIPVCDLSVARGYGAYACLITYGGNPFRLDAHIARFFNSAEILGIGVPVSPAALTEIVREGLERNPKGEYAIHMTLTGGVSEDFITPGEPSLIVGFYEQHGPTVEQYANGVKVVTKPWKRDMPRAKSLNYAAAVVARREAREQGAAEAVYVDATASEMYEGTTSNIFAVKDGAVVTPGEGILKGITRQAVFELCEQEGIECREGRLSVDAIRDYDEMFITSSTRGVLPVVQVDEQVVGDGRAGRVSKRLHDAFEALARRG